MNSYFIKQRAASRTYKKSKGAALLIMVGILLIALTTVAISRLSLNKIAIERGDVTAKSLGQAREALLGYALRVQKLGTTDLPLGTLPCPDTDFVPDGESNFVANGVCDKQRGLLPYVTLGLPELRDGSGALLWYAVANEYVGLAVVPYHPRSRAITTNLKLDSVPMASIILAPESEKFQQQRTGIGPMVAPASYLEGANADNNLEEYTAIQNESQNDQVIGISVDTFWTLVEKRISQVPP